MCVCMYVYMCVHACACDFYHALNIVYMCVFVCVCVCMRVCVCMCVIFTMH